MMPVCAYCKNEGSLTREHIWPKGLMQRLGPKKAYEPRSEKFHGGEPVIKDVCAACNNEKLSALDRYMCEIFDRYMAKTLMPGEESQVEYNYQLLLRGLLKISFNSARAMKNDGAVEVLEQYVPYILDGGHARNVQLRLQIVTSSRSINTQTGRCEDFDPYAYRCAHVPYDGVLSNRFLVRLVAINSFWFYLVFSLRKEPPHKWKKLINGLSNWRTPTGIYIPQNKSNLKIGANKTTYFHPELLGNLLHANSA